MKKLLVYFKPEERFKERYLYASKMMGFEPESPYPEADPADYAGLIMIGGGDMDPSFYGEENTASRYVDYEYDEACLKIIDRFFKAGKPILGICRGFQVLNVYFGGDLNQDIPGHMANGLLHEVHGTKAEGLKYPFPDVFITNTRHHQSVKTPGKGLIVSAKAFDDTIEAFEHENGLVLGVQWHPERMLDNMPGEGGDGVMVFDRFKQMIEEQEARE